MLWIYKAAAVFSRISKARIEDNAQKNRQLFREKKSPFREGNYIENQAEWGGVKFGSSKHSNMAYSGCEIMASCNAKLALGENVSEQAMADMISRYERKGAALNGEIGTSPKEIADYFKESGYEVIFSDSRNAKIVNEIGEKSDTVIVTAYNNRMDIMGKIHTVSVTKDEAGTYEVHNAYAYNRSTESYVAKGGYGTLQDAVMNMASAPAVICIIGIRKPGRVKREG